MRRHGGPRGPKHPFDIGRHRKASRPLRSVADLQARDLDGIFHRHVHQHLQVDAVRGVLEPAISLPVPGAVVRAVILDRRRRRSPQLTALLVAHVQRLARAIADRIVRPRRQLVLPTVQRPGESASLSRDLEAECGIGDDVDPRSRRPLPRAQQRDVFASASRETSKSIEEFEIQRRGNRLRLALRAARRPPCRGCGGCSQPIELIGQVAALPGQNHARNRGEPRARLFRDQIRAQQKYGAAGMARADRRLRLAHSKLCLQGELQLLQIGSGPFVQDDQINGKLLHPPVFVGAQKLARDGNVLDIVDSQEHDRQIPGDALSPQCRRPAAAPAYGIGRRPHRRVGVKHVARETLKEVGLRGIDTKMTKLNLRLRPRQGGRTHKGVGFMVFVHETPERRLANRQPRSRTRCAPWHPPVCARDIEARTPHRGQCPRYWTNAVRPSWQWVLRMSRPRPRNRARSVSSSGLPNASPSTTA